MYDDKFNDNYEASGEGLTGELRSTEENVYGDTAADTVYGSNPDTDLNGSDEQNKVRYGYGNPYYNGRLLPQYAQENTDRQRDRQKPVQSDPAGGAWNSGQVNPEQPVKNAKNKKKKNSGKKDGAGKRFARLVASALVFGMVAGVAFYGVNYGMDMIEGTSTKTERSAEEKSDSVETQQLASTEDTTTTTLVYDVSDIAEKVMPSIVSITSTYTTTYQYWYQEYQQESEGAGSGIILDKDDEHLMIVTNYHVVEDANEINVGFVDGEVAKAELKGYDEDADIAVLYVSFDDMKDSTVEAISIAQIGDSEALQVGEPAIAIGNALGYGQSVTVGYISALDRTIANTEGEFIQTDAAINPGNSGGALINTSGEVIGINSVKYVDSSVEGMGYAIPISDVYPLIQSIIEGTNKSNQGLGITCVEITNEYSQIYGFPEGVYVRGVDEDSAADAAGIIAGDIIVEFDGEEVYTIEELQKCVREKAAGETAEITAYRLNNHGRYEKVNITVTFN